MLSVRAPHDGTARECPRNSEQLDYLAELQTAYTAVVADALDQLGLRDRGARSGRPRPLPSATVAGRALPVRVAPSDAIPDPPYEDWIRLIETIEPGDAIVIAVDDGIRAATWGELFSCAARGRGARVAISDGLVRDATADR